MRRDKVLPLTASRVSLRLVFAGLTFLCFSIPFFLNHSQIITGALVNAALFVSAFVLPESLFLPIILLPSIGVLSRGLIFGPLTVFLVYFLPFIWLGNFSLIFIFKRFFKRLDYLFSVLAAALIKVAILFSFASLFVKLKIVPQPFLTAMGMNQLITACLGGLMAYPFFKKLR